MFRKLAILVILFLLISITTSYSQTKITNGKISNSKLGVSTCSFPCATILDDFNRADESPMTGWTDTWEPGSIGFGVFSNTARAASNANATAYKTTTNFGPQVDIAVDLSAINSYQQVSFLLVSEGTSSVDGYLLAYGGTSLELYRIDNAAFTLIAACSQTVTLSSGDSIGVNRTTGGNFTTYTCTSGSGCGQSGAGWTLRGTCTDNTYTAAGKVGLRSGGQSTTFDNLRVATR